MPGVSENNGARDGWINPHSGEKKQQKKGFSENQFVLVAIDNDDCKHSCLFNCHFGSKRFKGFFLLAPFETQISDKEIQLNRNIQTGWWLLAVASGAWCFCAFFMIYMFP